MKFLLYLTSLFLVLGISLSTVSAEPITQHVVFGDSLSDVGNVYDLSGGVEPLSPPNWEGRYSNGLTWTEIRANLRGLPIPTASRLGGTNYAYGGAETGTGESSIGNHALNMLDQADAYLANHSPNGTEQFLVWGGVNDVIDAYFISHITPDLSQSVANLSQLITSLVAAGGTDFMVLNMFPLDATPFGLSWSSSLRTSINQSVNNFNQLLAEEVDRLKIEQGLSIVYEDVHSRFLEMMADPEAFGFTNVTEPAWNEDAGEIVPNPEGYMFWDIVHPTTKTHELLATTHDPADFDDDSDVDGFDFLKWQRGESPISLSQSDLADWKENFGNSSSLVAASSIPEPSALFLATMAAVGLLMRRRSLR